MKVKLVEISVRIKKPRMRSGLFLSYIGKLGGGGKACQVSECFRRLFKFLTLYFHSISLPSIAYGKTST